MVHASEEAFLVLTGRAGSLPPSIGRSHLLATHGRETPVELVDAWPHHTETRVYGL